MKDKEVDEFEKKYGYKPTELPTAIDMLAVFVNKDNPVAERGLSLAEGPPEADRRRPGGPH